MQLTLDPVMVYEKPILANLLEKYDYEFSQYDLRDVTPLGLYGYDWLDCYWTDEHRYAFFIRADGKLAGFVMNNHHFIARNVDGEYNLSEFCVLYKYRRCGVGRFAVQELARRFPGRWELKLHPCNLPSAAFWPRVVGEITKGRYTALENVPGAVYDDGTPARVFIFDVPALPAGKTQRAP